MSRLASSLVLVALAVTGCASAGGSGTGGERPVADQRADGAAQLEQQRTDVRDVASSLLAAAEEALPGEVRTSGGQYRGCTGAFPDEYRSFAYRAHGRVDVLGSRPEAPFLEPLRGVLQQAGFTVEPEVQQLQGGYAVLRGTRGDLTASFTHTGGRFVGLDLAGPCVEVPEDTRDQWLGRKDAALR